MKCRSNWLIVTFAAVFFCTTSSGATPKSASSSDQEASLFIANYEKTIKPLEKDANLASWKASLTGKDEDFSAKEKLENEINQFLSNPEHFSKVKELKGTKIKNPILKRQIDLLYLIFLDKQIEPKLLEEITAKANSIEKKFNIFRAKVDGKELTDSEIRKILKESKDSGYRKKVWEATKEVGLVMAPELKELVKLRNAAAKKLGFKNYYVMQLVVNEQDEKDLLKLFDELDKLTRTPYVEMKSEIDAMLAAFQGISVKDLRPWHYHDVFFQESPSIFEVDLDKIYEKEDLVKLSEAFFAGVGLPVNDVLSRSDFFEKPGKSPHAFCTDIDREGDVRILVNIVPSEYWMNTMLHELGHAVYSKNIPTTLPYTLRNDAHIFMTEGIAMLFERLSKNADWLEAMNVKVESRELLDKTNRKLLRNNYLIFARWSQVMLRFEMGLYENPDGDLNKLWWDLVEKYQLVTRPEDRNAPDYAAKIHIITNPAYYHNYIMGEMFASQLNQTLKDRFAKLSKSKSLFVNNPKVGEYLKASIFEVGKSLEWPLVVKKATGESLNAKAFAKDLKN